MTSPSGPSGTPSRSSPSPSPSRRGSLPPLWIDTDLGVDDLMAILMVRAAGRPVDGCSLVFGNAALARVVANARAFAAAFDWPVPLHVGAARALVAPPVTAANVLGESGMPSRGRRLDETRLAPLADDATGALAARLDAADAPVDVLALGPLTNLAVVALAFPERFARIGRITWMGGAATRGNHTASAEFNAFADPEAVAVVARSGVPLAVLDLDVCRQVTVEAEDLEALARIDTARGRLLHDLFGGYIDIGLSRGRGSMALYDPVAAAALLDADAVRFERVALAVDLTGSETPGRTRVGSIGRCAGVGPGDGDADAADDSGDDDDARRRATALGETTIEIGREADAAAVRARLLEALTDAARAD